MEKVLIFYKWSLKLECTRTVVSGGHRDIYLRFDFLSESKVNFLASATLFYEQNKFYFGLLLSTYI